MKQYPISSYNKHICLKINQLMLYISLYLLKPYIIGLASIANRKDRSIIIEIFYTDNLIISFEAAAAIPLMALVYAFIKRSPGASTTVKTIWNNGKKLIIATAFLQLCVASSPLWLSIDITMTRISWIQIILYVLIIIYVPFSTYMKDCFADFPEPDQDKK